MTTEHGVGSKSKNVAWYFPPITAVSEPVRDLLENYSHYAADEVIPRILDIVGPLLLIALLSHHED
jgi:hypothetical protein